MLQERNLTNPTGTGIVRSKQSQHQRKSQTGPQMGDKEPKCKTEPPNRPPRCGNTTPCLRSGESFAPQPSSEGLASTRARRRESAGDSAQPQQPFLPAALLLPRSPGRAGTGQARCQAARPYMRPEPPRSSPLGTEQRGSRSVGSNFWNRP